MGSARQTKWSNRGIPDETGMKEMLFDHDLPHRGTSLAQRPSTHESAAALRDVANETTAWTK